MPQPSEKFQSEAEAAPPDRGNPGTEPQAPSEAELDASPHAIDGRTSSAEAYIQDRIAAVKASGAASIEVADKEAALTPSPPQ